MNSSNEMVWFKLDQTKPFHLVWFGLDTTASLRPFHYWLIKDLFRSEAVWTGLYLLWLQKRTSTPNENGLLYL